jgi:hypothetical protein
VRAKAINPILNVTDIEESLRCLEKLGWDGAGTGESRRLLQRCSQACRICSAQNPASVETDFVVHRVRSEVDLSRPRDDAEGDDGTCEEVGIAQRFPGTSDDVRPLKPRSKIDLSSNAIDELHVENTMIDDAHGAHSPGAAATIEGSTVTA